MSIHQAIIGAGVAVAVMFGGTGATRSTEARVVPAKPSVMSEVRASLHQAVVLSRDAVLVVVLDTAGELKARLRQAL